MNAYLEPVYPVLMNAVASPDRNFGLWLQESTLLYTVGMPVAVGIAATGAALIAGTAIQVHQRKAAKRSRTLTAYADAIAQKPVGAGLVLAGALMAGALSFSSVGPTRLSEERVMPVWHKPTAAQVLQAMTTCEYWVAPVGESNRFTCPVNYGERWEHFALKVASSDSHVFGRPGPEVPKAMRSVTVEQMAALKATADQLSKSFTQNGCYMPAHPAAHVWCPGGEATRSLTDWVIQADPVAFGHRTCGYGKTYLHTAQQHLEPKVKASVSAPALVRYTMPAAVTCGGDGIPLEELGTWIGASVQPRDSSHLVPTAAPVEAAVAVVGYGYKP